MRRILTLCAIGTAVVGTASAAPDRAPSDLSAVAPTLVPNGSRIIVAQEMDATFGVVAYDAASGGAGAFAVRWRGRWVAERSASIRFAGVQPARGGLVRRGTTLVRIRVRSAGVIVRSGLWVDGRRVQSVGAAGEAAYVADARAGTHTVVVFAATTAGAAATAWSFAAR